MSLNRERLCLANTSEILARIALRCSGVRHFENFSHFFRRQEFFHASQPVWLSPTFNSWPLISLAEIKIPFGLIAVSENRLLETSLVKPLNVGRDSRTYFILSVVLSGPESVEYTSQPCLSNSRSSFSTYCSLAKIATRRFSSAASRVTLIFSFPTVVLSFLASLTLDHSL